MEQTFNGVGVGISTDEEKKAENAARVVNDLMFERSFNLLKTWFEQKCPIGEWGKEIQRSLSNIWSYSIGDPDCIPVKMHLETMLEESKKETPNIPKLEDAWNSWLNCMTS